MSAVPHVDHILDGERVVGDAPGIEQGGVKWPRIGTVPGAEQLGWSGWSTAPGTGQVVDLLPSARNLSQGRLSEGLADTFQAVGHWGGAAIPIGADDVMVPGQCLRFWGCFQKPGTPRPQTVIVGMAGRGAGLAGRPLGSDAQDEGNWQVRVVVGGHGRETAGQGEQINRRGPWRM